MVGVHIPKPTSRDIRQGLGQVQRVLILSILLMTLMAMFSFVRTKYPAPSTIKEGEKNFNVRTFRAPIVSNETMLTESQRVPDNGNYYQRMLRRGRLTRTNYPVTLTTPYIIENANLCAGMITLLTIVHTSTGHFNQRERLRKLFGNIYLFKAKYRMRIVFLLGSASNSQTQEKIFEENDMYNDIVQGDFVDSYHNLTLKGVMAFRWVSNHCFHAKLVLKIDDDMYVNIFKLMEYFLPVHGRQKRQILCNVVDRSYILRRESKWSVDEDLFRGMKYYPPYCSGFFVLMTTDTVRIMYQAAQFTPFFWVDDVYLFGLLPSKGEIEYGRLNGNVSFGFDMCVECNQTSLACTVGRRRDWYYVHLWNITLHSLQPSMKSVISDKILQEHFKTKR